MTPDEFLRLAESLTGTPPKEISANDRSCLATILGDPYRQVDCSQFNELLLLVNKDRVSKCFFEHFFGNQCQVGKLRDGVEKFQVAALLRFGNFIYAFRTLARCRERNHLIEELGEFSKTSDDVLGAFAARSDKLLNVELIEREHTSLVGYLSASEIIAEHERAAFLYERMPGNGNADSNWGAFATRVRTDAGSREQLALETLISSYRERNPHAGEGDFRVFLKGARDELAQRLEKLHSVRDVATRNQDVYLTWDHMDVYFATSMRKQWEYEDLFDFVQKLMNDRGLIDLKLRHFDPTQAYTDNRVNKGLVESLMLKRARCTV